MKKLTLCLIPFILLVKTGTAQIVYSEYSQSYPTGTTDKHGNIGIITCIPEKDDNFWDISPNSVLQNTLQKDSAFLKNRSSALVAVNTFDTIKAQFFLHGVNKANAAEWEYRVMEWPDKVIVPWSPVHRFTDKTVDAMSTLGQMAYLGGYHTDIGNWIIVDARKKGSTQIATTSVVAWAPIRPAVVGIYTADELNLFLTRLARPWSYKMTPEEAYKWHKRYGDYNIDATTGLPKMFIAQPHENNLVFFLNAGLYKKEQLEYQIVRDDEVITPWKVNDFDNGFIWLRDLRPGIYQLNMRYAAQRAHVTTYPFMVKPQWYATIWARILTVVLALFFAAAVGAYALLIKQRQKTATEQSNKQKLQLELKAIYAQLNPHFIFNALSSIQGLINKQDIKGANSYLSDFAKLMREALNNSNNEQAPLKQELSILDTYLKLEQLRFGFKYEISIDNNINVYETDLPSLLLQPLVENAVKHGVSNNDDGGRIEIHINKERDDMAITITDNGPGFSPGKATGGFGLKLTTDRIQLLNELLKGQQIIFDIKSNSPTGTKIYLTFKNWFL